MDKRLQAFERLLDIMDDLRAKCPWDKKQTMETLRPLTIEETYELTDAITSGNLNDIREELGDVLLHIVFYAKIGSETGAFDIADVLNNLCDKLVHRHPHIYGDVEATTEEEVKKNWEMLKLKEGKKFILQGVPKSLPALVKATRIQEKVKQVGFDWAEKEGAFKKILEEIEELKVASDPKHVEEEFGDVMFSLINYARFIGVNPDNALARTNEKFIERFNFLENSAREKGMNLKEMTLNQMEALWEESKSRENKEILE